MGEKLYKAVKTGMQIIDCTIAEPTSSIALADPIIDDYGIFKGAYGNEIDN
jgi:hypothetical protein